MTWLDKLVIQYAEAESPKAFWYWSGLCAISAVVRDSVYLDRFVFKTYPNIYVMLHAASGLKKGPPVALAKRLVKKVGNTKIISGRSSIQGILKELGTAHSTPGGGISNKATGFICASEFSSSLVSDPAAMTILTDLYDRNYNEGDWQSLLKQETFNLTDPTISLLVATNEAHFTDFIDAKDIHGGFIGRMFVIAETKVQRLNPLIRKPDNVPNVDEMAEHLRKLALLKGPFESLDGTAAGNAYEEWYIKFYTQVAEQDVEDPTGTIQRFGDSVIKVAMLLSLSDNGEKVIELSHMEEAIGVCEQLIGNVRKTTHGKKGLSNFAQHKGMVLQELMHRDDHRVSRQILAKKYWMHFDSEVLDKIMVDFEIAGMIRASSQGNQVIYEMPAEQVEKMEKFLAGKTVENK